MVLGLDMTRTFLCMVVALACSCSFAHGAEETVQGAESALLELRIAVCMDKPNTTLAFMAKNTGKAPALVYVPELMGADTTKLVIRAPDGKILPYTGGNFMYYSRQRVALRSGQSFGPAKHDITSYYPISAPGKYVVHVECSLPDKKEKIRSNKVSFEVTRPNGKFLKSISTRQAFGNVPGVFLIEWEVFTHRRADGDMLYARQLLNRVTKRRVCVRVGSAASDEGIYFLADHQGTLHVLYALPKPAGLYAYDTVTRDLKVQRMGLYAPKKGRVPTLTLKVHVKGAAPVEEPAERP